MGEGMVTFAICYFAGGGLAHSILNRYVPMTALSFLIYVFLGILGEVLIWFVTH